MCAVFVVACKGGEADNAKPKPQPKPPTEPVATTDASPTAKVKPDKPTPRARPKPKKLSKAQKAEFTRLLREGRALQKTTNWAESVTTLEKALAIQPGSAPALSELSWSAFNAGDYEKAIVAGDDSVALSVDPRIRASSLYNLGRAAEKLGKKADAIRYYTRSSRLRPHKLVTKQLVALGGKPPVLHPVARCPKPGTLKQVCACLRRSVPVDGPNHRLVCETRGKQLDGFVLLAVGAENTSRGRGSGVFYLARKGAGKVEVASSTMVGFFDSHKLVGTLKLIRVHRKNYGARTLLHVYTEQRRFMEPSYMDISSAQVAETEREQWLTLCVENEGFIKCPLQIPVSRKSVTDVHKLTKNADPDIDRTEFARESVEARNYYEKQHKVKLPVVKSHKLKVDVAADGTAKVSFVSGDKTDRIKRYLGTTKLW